MASLGSGYIASDGRWCTSGFFRLSCSILLSIIRNLPRFQLPKVLHGRKRHVAKAITENTLFYGDNLDILRDYLIDECVDLVFLDPPFNSNRNYNVLFKDEQGLDSEAQITAFEDTWHWTIDTEHVYQHLITRGPDKVASMITA